MLPDKTTKCHRTGFEKTCFECVTQHGCRLWKHLVMEFDPKSGKPNIDIYDCMDSLFETYQADIIRRQVQTTASVDEFRKEAHAANDQHMAGAIARINRDIREMGVLGNAIEPQKLIGN